MPLESVIIFTDGSSRGNPGPGGFGAIIVADGNVTELGGREEETTNNRMELRAAIEALLRTKGERRKILLYCDSTYVVSGITKWVHGWQKRGWKTADKRPVLNRDLWEELLQATHGRDIEWRQVGGHMGVAGNERSDEIATAYADNEALVLYSGLLTNYGIRNILNVRGR